MSFEPYRLAELGDHIFFRITSPVSFECGQFMGVIVEHLGDNEFTVERDDEYHTCYVVKQLSPYQFEGGRGPIQ